MSSSSHEQLQRTASSSHQYNMSSNEQSSSAIRYPAVSSSRVASSSGNSTSSHTWQLNSLPLAESGFTLSPRSSSSTSSAHLPRLPHPSRVNAIHRAHNLGSRTHNDEHLTALSDSPPKLLENTLKLDSLGVSRRRPDPSIAPKVTLSTRCRPDPKVIFDQDPFVRHRQNFGVQRTGETRSTLDIAHSHANQGEDVTITIPTSTLQDGTTSTAGTTTVSSPTSSTDPLPAVATPASSLIHDAELTSSAAPLSPSLARRAAWTKPRSWADLASRMGPSVLNQSTVFSENLNGSHSTPQSPAQGSSANVSPVRRNRAFVDRGRTRSSANGTKKDVSLSTLVAQAETDFVAPLTYPRGMINKGNMCFANAILQVLVYCAPFYNLFQLLGEVVPHDFHNSTPLMEAVIQFLAEFQLIPEDVQRNFIVSPPSAVDALRELQAASEPFTPEALYDAMKLTKRFDAMRRGHQEDAEEFLGFFLDTLHEELQMTMQKSEARSAQKGDAPHRTHAEEEHYDEGDAKEEREVNRPVSPTEGDGWLEVGQKGKTSFTRTTSTIHSPITRIFGGKLRSVLRTPGSKDSVTLEPYQPLQLDIQPPYVTSIEEALENLTRPETISGVLSASKTLVDAVKQVFIETLPPILVVHLKRFYYDDIGGVQKSSKVLGYGPTLEIPESVISPSRRGDVERRYKLFGVVYHHGRFASGGHYTVDVLRQDRSEWLHIDDTAWTTTHTPSAKASTFSGGVNHATAAAASMIAAGSAPASPKQVNGQLASSMSDAGGGSAYLLFYVREDAIESASSTKATTTSSIGKASSGGATNGLLPPISVRKMAEAVLAGPGPVVPGAPLGARRAGGANNVGGSMNKDGAASNSPQLRRAKA